MKNNIKTHIKMAGTTTNFPIRGNVFRGETPHLERGLPISVPDEIPGVTTFPVEVDRDTICQIK